MVTMFKSTVRTFLKSKGQAFVICVLFVFIGFYFSLVYNTVLPLMSRLAQEENALKREQFRFAPIVELSDDDINEVVADYDIPLNDVATLSVEALVQKYAVDLSSYQDRVVTDLASTYDFVASKYHYKYIIEDTTVFQVSSVTNQVVQVNQIMLEAGEEPQNDNEAALSIGYAQTHNLGVGDKITINETVYHISGIYYDLGNTYIYHNGVSKTVFAQDNATVLVTSSAYERIESKDKHMYLGRFNATSNYDEAAMQTLRENDKVMFVTSSSDVATVGTLEKTLQSQLAMLYVGSILIFGITALFVGIFIRRYIDQSKKQFGTMLAMGYKKQKIIGSYVYFPVVFMVLTSFGTFIGYLSRGLMTHQLALLFNYPVWGVTLQLAGMIGFSIGYSLLVGIVMVLLVYRALSKRPLDLIVAQQIMKGQRVGTYIRKMLNKLSFKRHIKYAFAFSNIIRFVLMIFCIAISTMLIHFSLSLYGGFHQGIATFAAKTSFTEMVIYDEVKNGIENDNTANNFFQTTSSLSTLGEIEMNKTVVIQFLDLTAGPLAFELSGDQSGIIVPLRYKYFYNIGIGDDVTLKGPRGLFKQQVIGFNDLAVNDIFYLPHAILSEYEAELSDTAFNGVYVNNIDDVPTGYESVITKASLIAQAKELQQNTIGAVIILISFSLFSAFFLVNGISNNNVGDNIQGMVIMLSSGYRKRTVSALILNIYSIAILVGGIIATVFLPPCLKHVTMMVNVSDIGFIQLSFDWFNLSIAFGANICIYYFSLFMTMRKYRKLNMRVILAHD